MRLMDDSDDAHRIAVQVVREYGSMALQWRIVREHYPGRTARVVGRALALYALVRAAVK